jgi:hypothetical protein
MYPCPHCGECTIGLFRKWLSAPALPARCGRCQMPSSVPASSGGNGLAVLVLGLLAGGIVAITLHSPWPVAVAAVPALLFYGRHWHSAELRPLSDDAVDSARKSEGLGVLALLLGALLK